MPTSVAPGPGVVKYPEAGRTREGGSNRRTALHSKVGAPLAAGVYAPQAWRSVAIAFPLGHGPPMAIRIADCRRCLANFAAAATAS